MSLPINGACRLVDTGKRIQQMQLVNPPDQRQAESETGRDSYWVVD